MRTMEGLFTNRLAYCDTCKTMRVFFEAKIPSLDGATNKRPATEYVCATCYWIIATFEHVTAEEFKAATKDIDSPELRKSLLTA